MAGETRDRYKEQRYQRIDKKTDKKTDKKYAMKV
jgi:hypothetical protein